MADVNGYLVSHLKELESKRDRFLNRHYDVPDDKLFVGDRPMTNKETDEFVEKHYHPNIIQLRQLLDDGFRFVSISESDEVALKKVRQRLGN